MTNRVDGSERESYYGDGRQPWDDIVEAGLGPAFAAASILKYMRRTKGEREKDLIKARWYFARLTYLYISNDSNAETRRAFEWLGRLLTNEELNSL